MVEQRGGGARRRSAVKKKEGGKGRKMEGWRILGKMDGIPRSRRGNAKRRDESLKEGKKTG